LDASPKVRIKDLTRFSGVRENQISGYGLVVGLDGTGDDEDTFFTAHSVANMLQHFGITVDRGEMKVENIAAVIVTAELPPFSRKGDRIDVVLSSLGNAETLEGGILLQTPLLAADGNIYAVAQGPVSIGGSNVNRGGGLKNHPTVAHIPKGAIIEREVTPTIAKDGSISIILRNPDFTTCSRLVKAIDSVFGEDTAKAEDASKIVVSIPDKYKGDVVLFAAMLEEIEVEPDLPTKVVVNERTGTIVMGGDVKISRVAVTHGNISLTVMETIKGAEEEEIVREKKENIFVMPEGADVNTVVSTLNAVGATPRDIIAILEAIKQAGALHAELVVM
jgi:flagellar P-ring protein precursor FlgI